MKQHITTEQLEELSEKGMENFHKGPRLKYVKEADEHGYGCSIPDEQGGQVSYPLLSIGQMIEFIRDNDKKHLWTWYFFDGPHATTKDICGILWEAVKEILEK